MLLFNLLISIVTSIYFFFSFQSNELENKQVNLKKFEHDFLNVFDYYRHPLDGIRSSIHFSNFNISSSRFRLASESRGHYKDFSGALGFGFVRKVHPTDLESYLKTQKQFRPEFKLKRMSPQAENESLFVIELIEPVEINENAVGLVISDEPNRKDAAIQSMISGRPTLTQPIQLVQVQEKEPGFLLFSPIYRAAKIPETKEQRIEQLFGWAYAPITAKSIIASVERNNPSIKVIDLHLVSGSQQVDNFFSHDSKLSKLQTEEKKEIEALGKKWLFKLAYQSPESLTSTQKSAAIFFILFLMSLIMANIVKAQEEKNKFNQILLTDFQKQVELATQEIELQRHFLQNAIDNVPVLLGYWDKKLINKLSNATYFKFFGLKPHEIYNRHMSEVLGPVYEKNAPYIHGVLRGEPQTFERELMSRDGMKSTLAQYTPDFDQFGNVKGFFVLISDITELKRVQSELDSKRKAEVHSNKLRALGEMSAGIAHEINNPLAIIDGNSRILSKFLNDPEKFKTKQDQIINACSRIQKITNGLRKFSRTSENEEHKVHRLERLIEESLVLLGTKLRKVNAKIEYDFEENLEIVCNQLEIEQVFVNIIGNAFDAIAECEEKWIKIRATSDAQKTVIQITNAGPQISPEVQEKLFQPFFTTKAVGSGTGLGLSISKGLIENHGGSLMLNNSFKNTCFEIRLPRKDASQLGVKNAA